MPGPATMLALLKRMAAPACALLLLALAAAPAAAQTFDEAVARFAADSFADTEAAVAGVAASGHAMAAPVIRALQDGRLLFDAAARKVFIRERSGRLLDAASGNAVAGEPLAGLKPVRLNNRLRRAVEAALGGLTLMAPDPQRRLEAAQAVLKSREAGALPALEAAIAKETDARVKQALEQA